MIDDFETYILAERRYAAGTAANYVRDVRRFMADNGIDEASFDPALVTPDDLRKWIMGLTKQGLAPGTVNRMVCSVRAFFRWLRRVGVVDGDPFLRIAQQRTPSRLPTYIPEGKMLELVRELPDGTIEEERNALIITLFYATGIRLAELLGIHVRDFSPSFDSLRVLGKGKKERIVPLAAGVAAKTANFIERLSHEICISPENPLFLSQDGQPLSRGDVYRIVRGVLTTAGVQGKKSPHVLRHTFATHMLDEGADMREIQELLGHASLAATQVYTHNSIAQLKDVYRNAHPRGRKK